MTPDKTPKGSAISRVLEIIEAVAQAENSLSPADLSEMLGIPKPSIHRLLQQIQAEGFLQTDMRGTMVPSNRLHRVAMGVIYASRYKAARQAILRKLAADTGETCGIAMPNGVDMIYYDRVQSDWPLQLHLPVGAHVPMWCTASGKLYLSTFPKTRRRQIIDNLALKRYSRHTITDPDQLEAALVAIQKNDLGIDNEEFVDGMVACAVPIKDGTGRMIASLFTHAPTLRKNMDNMLQLVPVLRHSAAELGRLIDMPQADF